MLALCSALNNNLLVYNYIASNKTTLRDFQHSLIARECEKRTWSWLINTNTSVTFPSVILDEENGNLCNALKKLECVGMSNSQESLKKVRV